MSAQQILQVSNSQDIIFTRMQVREAARRAGMGLGDQARISLAISSLLEGLGLWRETNSNSSSTSLTIEHLNKGPKSGLRLICAFANPEERHPVLMAAENIGWMVDDLDIHYLSNDQVEIKLTKWVVRR